MAHHLARSFSLLWLLIITMAVPCFGSGLATSTETSVAIQNLLEDEDDLTVHCKSTDDDIGVQNLKHGEHFMFHFIPNVSGSTIFNCSFAWNNGVCRRFDIYEHDNDNMFTDLKWQIFNDGPCLFTPHADLVIDDDDDDDYGDDDICYEWSDDPC